MRRAIWLLAVLSLTAAAPPTVGIGPAEPYPGLPRYALASPIGRPGAWEVTPEQLEAEGLPSHAAALRAPGTYVPLNDTTELQRFFDAVKTHNFSLLFNGTYYAAGGTHADGPGGACCYQVVFRARGHRDPTPWQTTPEALRAQGFPFVAQAIERSGTDLPITERTDEALRFVKALRQRGARQLEVEGGQYLVGFHDPPFPPPDPGEKSYAVLVRVVDETPPTGAAWSTSPEDLERLFLLGHAAALAAPGKHVGASDCRGGVCPGIAAFHAALRERNATHLRWNGADYVVRYVTTGAGGVPGEAWLQFLGQGVYVHASDQPGTFWLASPDDLARAGMPTIGEALNAPGRFVPFPEGGANEVEAYKLGLREREAVHLRHAGRLWEVKFAAEWQLLAPNQSDTAVSLGTTLDQDAGRTQELPGPAGNLTVGPRPFNQTTPLPTILGAIALLLAARLGGDRSKATPVHRWRVRVQLWHNPRCNTSRKAKAGLEAAGAELEVVEYMKGRVTRVQWAALLDAVGGDPTRLLRSREPLYHDLKLDQKTRAGKVGREQVLDLLVKHPQLLERPVVVRGGKGLIARPAENALDALR